MKEGNCGRQGHEMIYKEEKAIPLHFIKMQLSLPMTGVMSLLKSYIHDESAVDDGVMKIIFIVLAIIAVMAIGWFAWNLISDRANTATEQIEGNTNPGKGNEFGGNPFGN